MRGPVNSVAIALVGLSVGQSLANRAGAAEDKQEVRTVRAHVQMKPGGELKEVEMEVHEAATELEIDSADRAGLEDEDLVLGVVADGQAMAYPIRYLALYEVANDRVGEVPLAPTW